MRGPPARLGAPGPGGTPARPGVRRPEGVQNRRGVPGGGPASRGGQARSRRWATPLLTLILLASSLGWAAPAGAQDFPEVPYDGRFTFVRVAFETGRSGLRSFSGMRGPMWAHDYPRAEQNFSRILDEVTLMKPYLGGSRILTMDDPEIFRYPVLYIVEVGYWAASDEEVANLGAFLQKGGFLIVDDFRDRQIYNIQDILARAVPGARLMEVPDDHEIFDSFFRIEDPRSLTSYGWQPPSYLGIFEDNDPDGRLMAILNYNGDIAEYWEISDQGYVPIDLTNEAYKFGVNYIVYSMTH